LIDTKLIEECRAGNLNNFKRLLELSVPIIFPVAFRILGSEDQAKDIVQETMVVIWQKLKTIKSAEVYNAWLYRIAVNKCYDQLRKKRRNPEFMADDTIWSKLANSISDDQISDLENNELAGIINLLTNRLSPKQKTVFVLSEIEQISNDEIAEITGMSKTGIKANLHYARKRISEMIEKYL
jgi:RNA polymerase sigma-70 factor (ECF subfamily)